MTEMLHELKEVITKNLRYKSAIRNVKDLIKDRHKINHAPSYQRNYVWSNEKASYFIESILKNSEIPPLVLFCKNEKLEVIDGRQRYETILRFIEGKFKLSGKGLSSLKSLSGKRYDDLREDEFKIFNNIQLRVYIYELHNNIPYNDNMEEAVKREIFARYNSGITPLTHIDVIKARYIDNELNVRFKTLLDNDPSLLDTVRMLFAIRHSDIQLVLRKIRQLLVMHHMPVHSFGHNKQKIDIIYDHYSHLIQIEGNWEMVFTNFKSRINFLLEIQATLNTIGGQVFECLYWAMSISSEECTDINKIASGSFKKKLVRFMVKNQVNFEKPANYYRLNWINDCFHKVAAFFEMETGIQFEPYLRATSQFRTFYNDKLHTSIKKQEHTIVQNGTRLKKDATSISISSILDKISEGSYLVRPYYQRGKVINITKSSAIIESVLLGFEIPPIFVYRRKNGKTEVIDGQQRLLTFISFIGTQYLDERNQLVLSENNRFSLNLKDKMHSDLHGKKFKSLDEYMQKKITEYNLSIVEINEETNPDFDPIDQFVRFNLKPYPINPNTFESWNALVDKRFIDKIKTIYKSYGSWFYILRKNERMYNEEQITRLVYFYYTMYKVPHTFEQVQQVIAMSMIENRLHLRFNIKNAITKTLLNINALQELLDSCDHFEEDFIYKIQTLLTATTTGPISEEFELLLFSNTEKKSRTTHRFYLLAIILVNIPIQNVENFPDAIRESIIKISSRISKVKHVGHFEQLIEDVWRTHGSLKYLATV